MAKRKPVVAFLHYYCPPVIGGVEVVIDAHAKLFADAGYETRMIVGNGKHSHPCVKTVVIPEMATTGGPLAKSLKTLSRASVPREFNSGVALIEKKLEAALKGVDVCFMHNVLTMHFNMMLTAALANIMAKGGKTRFIGWTHDLTFADPRYAAFCKDSYPWNLLKTKLTGCDYCVISKQRKKFTHKIMGIPLAKIPVVPDGIGVGFFLELTPRINRLVDKEDLDDKDIIVVTPARILPRKRLEFGVEIIAGLKRLGKSVRWLVTGAPDPYNISSYQASVVGLIKKLKVEEEIVFLGMEKGKSIRVADNDVHSLYALSDVLIFASRREGFGIPVLEGAIARNLLVLSRIPVLREITRNSSEVGVVWVPEKGVCKGDLEMLGRAKSDATARQIVKKLESSPQLVLRKEIMRQYSWSMIFKEKLEPMATATTAF